MCVYFIFGQGRVLSVCVNFFNLGCLFYVLEHGKPHERSAIVKQLTGQIVQMSQQKFASKFIENCLTFGTPTEHQHLVNEKHQYGALISLSLVWYLAYISRLKLILGKLKLTPYVNPIQNNDDHFIFI